MQVGGGLVAVNIPFVGLSLDASQGVRDAAIETTLPPPPWAS